MRRGEILTLLSGSLDGRRHWLERSAQEDGGGREQGHFEFIQNVRRRRAADCSSKLDTPSGVLGTWSWCLSVPG